MVTLTNLDPICDLLSSACSWIILILLLRWANFVIKRNAWELLTLLLKKVDFPADSKKILFIVRIDWDSKCVCFIDEFCWSVTVYFSFFLADLSLFTLVLLSLNVLRILLYPWILKSVTFVTLRVVKYQ